MADENKVVENHSESKRFYLLLIGQELDAAKDVGLPDVAIDDLTLKQLQKLYGILNYRLQDPSENMHPIGIALYEIAKRRSLLTRPGGLGAITDIISARAEVSNSYYKDSKGRCIGGIASHVEENKLILMVAWESEIQAKKGNFRFYKGEVSHVDPSTIAQIADSGVRITEKEELKYFPSLSAGRPKVKLRQTL